MGGFPEEWLPADQSTFSLNSADALNNTLDQNPNAAASYSRVYFYYKKEEPKKPTTKSVTVNITLPDGSVKSQNVTVNEGGSYDATAFSGYDPAKHVILAGSLVHTYDSISDGGTITIRLGNKSTPPSEPAPPVQQAKVFEVRRFYHTGLRVHLYSNNPAEIANLRRAGWKDEGVAFSAATDRSKGQTVFRLYNPHIRRHLFTRNSNEYNVLATRGWRQEGVAFQSHGSVPVYRLYHAGIGRYLYTKDSNEYNVLATRGWRQEGVAWMAEK